MVLQKMREDLVFDDTLLLFSELFPSNVEIVTSLELPYTCLADNLGYYILLPRLIFKF